MLISLLWLYLHNKNFGLHLITMLFKLVVLPRFLSEFTSPFAMGCTIVLQVTALFFLAMCRPCDNVELLMAICSSDFGKLTKGESFCL